MPQCIPRAQTRQALLSGYIGNKGPYCERGVLELRIVLRGLFKWNVDFGRGPGIERSVIFGQGCGAKKPIIGVTP